MQKEDRSQGEVNKCKIWMVARGLKQIEGENLTETFASSGKGSCVRGSVRITSHIELNTVIRWMCSVLS